MYSLPQNAIDVLEARRLIALAAGDHGGCWWIIVIGLGIAVGLALFGEFG